MAKKTPKGTQLAIPSRPGTAIVAGFNLSIRKQLEHTKDIGAIEEGRRRLAAWHAYVTGREQRVELNAATRWCELRIGELLGKAKPGPPTEVSLLASKDSVPSQDRHKFRLMAQHKKLVIKLIQSGQVSRAKLLAAIKEATFKPPAQADKTYPVLLADPPWQYNFAESDTRIIEKEYPTMTVEQLCKLRIPAGTDAVIYLWATAPKLSEAMQVLEAWKFNYKTCAVWDKEKIGMGYWFRGQHELLLVGVRGDMSPPAAKNRVSSVIHSPRSSHSAKPDAVYELIEKGFPTRPKVELFARALRPGWDSWGNEVDTNGQPEAA